MIEQIIAKFSMPYRENLVMQAFTFGIDEEGRTLGGGALTDGMDREIGRAHV